MTLPSISPSLTPPPHPRSLTLTLSLTESDHLLGGLSSGHQVGRGRHTVPCHQAVTVNGADMGDMLIHLASNSARRSVRSPPHNLHTHTHTHSQIHISADTLSHVTLNFLEYVY